MGLKVTFNFNTLGSLDLGSTSLPLIVDTIGLNPQRHRPSSDTAQAASRANLIESHGKKRVVKLQASPGQLRMRMRARLFFEVLM